MNAVIWTGYGGPDVLRPGTIPTPVPGANEILIRVEAATVTAGDCEIRSLRLPLAMGLPMRLYAGVLRPRRIRVLGQEVAGTIVTVGSGITDWNIGDDVFGTPGMGLGAYAEFACLSLDDDASVLARKPDGVPFAEAAASVMGGLEALYFLGEAKLTAGQSLLINGAGGSIGSMALQLAKRDGLEVTAVDSAGKFEMLRVLGADHCIDYQREDFSALPARYDAVLDMIGGEAFGRCLRVLREGGRYMMANPSGRSMIWGRLRARKEGKVVIGGAGTQRGEDLRRIAGLLASGEIRVVIDSRYPLDDIAEAHRHAESGAKLGNIVIDVAASTWEN